ncbi:MAG TPA: tRNA (adenosine(37)-N6)-threonylcarbamoyltransferase complex transferase subunit TsaD [Myxococcota bacterium]|nr:tRNA (adenosine(37)-N6)-threonylcarbamoyltransferase complex transferase subunit TsaD [Myxococcota bacterium]
MTKILGLETSCDDTAAAIVDENGRVLGEAVFSQNTEHQAFGGVVPEIGSRAHIEQILPVVKSVFAEAAIQPSEIDAVAATFAPGLVGPLLVGAQFAKGMASALNVPLLAIHHIEGHIFSGYGDKNFPKPPFLALIVSGGHTAIYACDKNYVISVIGETLDDAAGEAFDKLGRALGFSYPAGKTIDELAMAGDKDAFSFPIAMRNEAHFDFSFSGLKTKVLEVIRKTSPLARPRLLDLCASVREAIALALAERSVNAAMHYGMNNLVLGGGVAANSRLRELLTLMCAERDINLYLPQIRYCTDNAVMIANAAHIRLKEKRFSDFLVDVSPTLPIEGAFIDQFRVG